VLSFHCYQFSHLWHIRSPMSSTCVHVVRYTSLCTSSTLHTLSIVSCKFNFSFPFFPDLTMPRATRNRRRLSNTVNLASMELGQLLALPRQSLVLLASARHLVTTGSKARLANGFTLLSTLSHRPLALPSLLVQTTLLHRP